MSDATLVTGQEPTGSGGQQVDGQQGQGTGDGGQPAQGQQTQGQQGDGSSTQKTDEVVYEFEIPQGIEVDQARLDQFKGLAKELGLTADAAKKVVEMEVARVQQAAEQHLKTITGWADAVKSDKEIGGDKLAENLATARKAIDLGPPELKELLNSTGLGNHPAVVKWALAVGKKLSEDAFVPGGKTTVPQNTEEARAARMYPTTAA